MPQIDRQTAAEIKPRRLPLRSRGRCSGGSSISQRAQCREAFQWRGCTRYGARDLGVSVNQGAVSQVLSSIGLYGREPHASVVPPPPAEIDAKPCSRQPPVRCVCFANPGSYPAGTISRSITKTRRVLMIKTRRGAYHRNLGIRSVLDTGAGYQRSAATYTRHALLLFPSAHQPA